MIIRVYDVYYFKVIVYSWVICENDENFDRNGGSWVDDFFFLLSKKKKFIDEEI